MRTIIIALLLLCTSIMPCLAGTDPSVSVKINTVGDYKDYVYALTNDTDSGIGIGRFTIYMPESAARSVISFTTSRENWYVDCSFRGNNSMWAMAAYQGYRIAPGGYATFTLRTPASVPTSYSFKPDLAEHNWQWNVTFAGSYLPVPVPEPSSIPALFGGIAGLGRFILKRKKNKSVNAN